MHKRRSDAIGSALTIESLKTKMGVNNLKYQLPFAYYKISNSLIIID